MKFKIVFALSAMLIGIGLVGLARQQQPAPTSPDIPVVTAPSSVEKTEMPANALARKALRKGDILGADDYISGDKNLEGYLVLKSVAEGVPLLADVIESPESPTYLAHSLSGEMLPWGYEVNKKESYLLSSLRIGDNVSIALRYTDLAHDVQAYTSDTTSGKTGSKRYIVKNIVDNAQIISIRKEPNAVDSSRSNDEVYGSVIVRLTQRQFKTIKVVEKQGEILLFSSNGTNGSINSVDILPEKHVIKELRGKK